MSEGLEIPSTIHGQGVWGTPQTMRSYILFQKKNWLSFYFYFQEKELSDSHLHTMGVQRNLGNVSNGWFEHQQLCAHQTKPKRNTSVG